MARSRGEVKGGFVPGGVLRLMIPGANSTMKHWRLDGVSTMIPRFDLKKLIDGRTEMRRGLFLRDEISYENYENYGSYCTPFLTSFSTNNIPF